MLSRTTVKPFRGLLYNERLLGQIGRLSCPPYDIISPQQERNLKKSSPYNFCNILLKGPHQTYEALGRRFYRWLKEGVLQEDRKEAFYLCEQRFKFSGRTYCRWGMLGLLRLNAKNKIFPHERTHRRAKEDRTNLLEKVEANLSPVFVIYKPAQKDVIKLLAKKYRNRLPLVEFNDREKINYRLWRLTNKKDIKNIQNYFERRRLLIADGHHRFEVARNFYLQHKKNRTYSDINYILSYISPADDNLLLLPIHRVINLDITVGELMAKLKEHFRISKTKNFKRLYGKLLRAKTFSFIVYSGGKALLFSLKDKKTIFHFLTSSSNSVYCKLDVYLFHQMVLKGILKVEPEEKDIIYVNNDARAAVKLAREKKKTAFILRPCKKEDIMNIALGGKILPQKSTYFYPKFISGLVGRKL